VRQCFTLAKAHKGRHFVKEHLIALKSFRRHQQVGCAALRVKDLGFTSGIIPANPSILAGDLERVGRGALIIIQMHAGYLPGSKAKQDVGVIFHIHLKLAQLPSPGTNTFHLSQQPAQIVQRVRKCVHHTPAKIGASRVRAAVVLPGVPARQVFAPVGVRRERLAKLTAFDQGLQLVQHRVKAEMKPHHSWLAALCKRRSQFAKPGETI